LHPLVPRRMRGRANFALALTAAFAALIVLNYVLQTTFVPALASPLHEGDAPLVAALTMSNPRSLGWALEMWGYGLFGVATWAIAPVFRATKLERAARAAFTINGVASILGAVAIAAWPGSPHTVPGLIAFACWNLLMIVMATLVLMAMHRRP